MLTFSLEDVAENGVLKWIILVFLYMLYTCSISLSPKPVFSLFLSSWMFYVAAFTQKYCLSRVFWVFNCVMLWWLKLVGHKGRLGNSRLYLLFFVRVSIEKQAVVRPILNEKFVTLRYYIQLTMIILKLDKCRKMK